MASLIAEHFSDINGDTTGVLYVRVHFLEGTPGFLLAFPML